jgi:hypothetical protein
LGESIEKPEVGLMVPEISAGSIADTIRRFYEQDRQLFAANIRKEKDELSWEKFANALSAFSKQL